MQTEPRARFYHPELDGLRFIAFLLVFIHNALPILSNPFLKKIAEYGWIGVDLFFCLSAFLITKLLVTEYEQAGKINIRNFYIRRILRIWPLYFFYISLALFFPLQSEISTANILKHVAGLATFTYNFVYFYLNPNLILAFVHLWTISYEEQFYAVIPWVLRKLITFTEESMWALLATIFLLGNSVRALFIYLKIEHPAIYLLPFTHFDSILGGLAIGLGSLDRPLNRFKGSTLLFFGVVSNAMVFLLPNNDINGAGLMLTYPLLGLGTSLIIFSAVKKDSHLLTKFLGNKLLVYLGRISYGLYIFHFLSLALASQICNKILGITSQQISTWSSLVFIIGLSLTILFAILSYYWIEKPFLKWKDKFSLVLSRSA